MLWVGAGDVVVLLCPTGRHWEDGCASWLLLHHQFLLLCCAQPEALQTKAELDRRMFLRRVQRLCWCRQEHLPWLQLMGSLQREVLFQKLFFSAYRLAEVSLTPL